MRTVDDIGMSAEEQKKIGINGSPTIVAGVENIESDHPPIVMCSGQNEEQLVDSLMDNIKKGGNKLEKKAEKAKKEADTTGLEAVDLRGDNKGILTWAEVVNGKIARPSIELLTAVDRKSVV